MFGLFKSNPLKKMEREYDEMLEKARDIQRSGDIKGYAKIMGASEELWEKIEEIRKEKGLA